MLLLSGKENYISILVFFLSVHRSRLPPILLGERALFSHRLQVRISVLLNQINPVSLLRNESPHYHPNASQHQSPFKINPVVLWS